MRKIKMISGCRTYGSVVFDSGNLGEFKTCDDEKCENCQAFHKAMRDYVDMLIESKPEVRYVDPQNLSPFKQEATLLLTPKEAIERYPNFKDIRVCIECDKDEDVSRPGFSYSRCSHCEGELKFRK